MKTVKPSDWETFQPERIGLFIPRQIGDMLPMAPALHALRERFPHAEIIVLHDNFTTPIAIAPDGYLKCIED